MARVSEPAIGPVAKPKKRSHYYTASRSVPRRRNTELKHVSMLDIAVLCHYFKAKELNKIVQSTSLPAILAACRAELDENRAWQRHCTALEGVNQGLATFGESKRSLGSAID